ncbi:MAG TPA: DUF1697 domain-containing protein [Acidimicrobiales bacterium]|jgi:uncharacterized protein (DUF1697 family)|nr:DUF1697 domain-containing protein [Acidimicrobiales bacterium]
MSAYVAMLRSINVGGRNRVAMADLEDLVASLGFSRVTTYLQSGNVVCTGSGSPAATARRLQQAIATQLGLDIPVIVRTRPQLTGVVEGSPYAEPGVDPTTLHVTFLATSPAPERGRRLAGEAEAAASDGTFGADRFELVGDAVYVHCPGGYGQTKLNNAFFERRLGVTATTRNWRTVTTLADLAAESARRRPSG